LKNIIKLKDSGYINVKILISTRRPEIITSELFNVLDDNIEVFLDNERIFNECDLIFLCVQPHQLDLIIKEISTLFQERIEKLKKRKGKIFPVIVSFLAAFTVEKLASLFPEEVSVFRTYLIPSLIKDKAPSTSNNKTFDYSQIPYKNSI
jgi:pyrroline-5-carboxylate reductase